MGTCHRPGSCKGRSSGCPASCPANDPTVAGPACLQHCQPGLAQLLPIHRVFSALLMTVPPAAQGTTLLRERQQLTTEPAVLRAARPRITAAQHTTSSGPDAVVSSASRVTKDTAEAGALGARTPPHSPVGKQDHRAGLIRHVTQPASLGPGALGAQLRVPSLALKRWLISKLFTCEVCSQGTWPQLRRLGYLLKAVKLSV